MLLEERKVLIRFLPILLLFNLSAFALHADAIDQPDIRTQTLEQYMAADLEELIGTSAQAQLFRESHEAFLLSTDKWAAFNEEIQWFDHATGELIYGSGGGEVYLQVSAILIWERILKYRQLVDSINRNGTIDFMYGDGTGVIGRY